MNNFFSELSRRNVFRVAAAYVIVGWIVLQVVGLLAPNLGLPAWTVALIFVILLSTFPIAMFLTWAFEMTPDGVRKTEAAEEAGAGTSRTDVGLIIVGVLVIATSVLMPSQRVPLGVSETSIEEAKQGPAPRNSVAVLPFNNLSDVSELSWIADGLSEDITTRLGSNVFLHVAARNSAFQFKGQSPDIRQVGEDLGVRFVLEGSLRKIGDQLRVTAQLIETDTGAHIWTDNYDHSLNDIAHLQDEVVDVISAESLNAIQRRELNLMSASPPETLTSEELGQLALAKAFTPFAPANFPEALELLELAFTKNPNNARAHGVYANLHGWQRQFDPKHASELEELADKHIAIALEQAPFDLAVLNSATFVMISLGRKEECLRFARRSVEVNPNMSDPWLQQAKCKIQLGDYPGARVDWEQWSQLAGTRPSDFYNATAFKAEIHLGLKEYAAAETAAREVLAYGETHWPYAILITALVYQGKMEEARLELANSKKTADYQNVDNYERAMQISYDEETMLRPVIDALRRAEEEQG